MQVASSTNITTKHSQLKLIVFMYMEITGIHICDWIHDVRNNASYQDFHTFCSEGPHMYIYKNNYIRDINFTFF